MPSNLRSKIHSGPLNRSWVSVAAIGSSQSGNAVRGIRDQGAWKNPFGVSPFKNGSMKACSRSG